MSFPDATMSRFSLNVLNLLKSVEYVIADTMEQREAIYRLRYEANLREGTIGPNETQSLHDDFEETPNCLNIGVMAGDKLVAALRLHVLTQDMPHSVLLGAYPDLVPPIVALGKPIIDVTRLVADYAFARTAPGLPYVVTRLSLMAAAHYGADTILAAVRQEHVPFYQRMTFATKLCEPRPYPMLSKPLALFKINFKDDHAAMVARYPFCQTSHEECARVFGAHLLDLHQAAQLAKATLAPDLLADQAGTAPASHQGALEPQSAL